MKRRLQLDNKRRELGHDKGEKIVTPQGLSPSDWKKHLCILCCIYTDVSPWVCVHVGETPCLRISESSLIRQSNLN